MIAKTIFKLLTYLAVVSLALFIATPSALSQDTPQSLIRDLNCTACHTELNLPSPLRDLSPDLGSAGLRYNPAWVFEFLQRPGKIRKHIGSGRMPDFKFSEKEALAL